MPLFFAVRAVASTGDRIAPVGDDVRQAALGIAADVERYVTADPTRDERGTFAEARPDSAKAASGNIDPSASHRTYPKTSALADRLTGNTYEVSESHGKICNDNVIT